MLTYFKCLAFTHTKTVSSDFYSKAMHRFIYLSIFLLCNLASLAQNIQREGLVNYVSSLDPEGFRRYTLFEDSTVIYEIYEQYSETRNDTLIAEGNRLAYYTILDLPTMHAQDYFLFSEDSEPVTDYNLNENEFISWGAFKKNIKPDKHVDSLIKTTDTVIDGREIKRLWYTLTGPGWQVRLTCGLSCSIPKTIFHLNRSLDDKYPDCQVTYFLYEDLVNGFSTSSKLSLIRDSLTESEKIVFKKWKSNLANSSLPNTTATIAKKFITTLRRILRTRDYK